jgi:hypothetical protein
MSYFELDIALPHGEDCELQKAIPYVHNLFLKTMPMYFTKIPPRISDVDLHIAITI